MRPGPAPSASAMRPDHRLPAVNADLKGSLGVGAIPDPNDRWGLDTTAQWHEFWSSALTQVLIQTDIPALRRLFDLYDIYERTMDLMFSGVMADNDGSGGLLFLGEVHPAVRQLDILAKQIERLEERFGVTPLVRAKLGLTIGDLQRAESMSTHTSPVPQPSRRRRG